MPYSDAVINNLHSDYRKVIAELRQIRFDLIAKTEKNVGSERGKEYLRHGVGRRIGTLERCLENVFSLFPPSRTEPLTRESLQDVQINVQAHAINVIGVFDNWAHVFVAESGRQLNPLQIGLFKKETKRVLPSKLREYLDHSDVAKWHAEYAKDYRDSLAHRIPLYVPPAEMTVEENAAYQKTDARHWQAIFAGNLEEAERLDEVKASIGRASLRVIHSFVESAPIYLHPQLICDAMTVRELSAMCMKELDADIKCTDDHQTAES